MFCLVRFGLVPPVGIGATRYLHLTECIYYCGTLHPVVEEDGDKTHTHTHTPSGIVSSTSTAKHARTTKMHTHTPTGHSLCKASHITIAFATLVASKIASYRNREIGDYIDM